MSIATKQSLAEGLEQAVAKAVADAIREEQERQIVKAVAEFDKALRERLVGTCANISRYMSFERMGQQLIIHLSDERIR